MNNVAGQDIIKATNGIENRIIARKEGETLNITVKMNRKHEEDLQRLRGFRLLDDDFMTKCFEDNTDCAELVLKIC